MTNKRTVKPTVPPVPNSLNPEDYGASVPIPQAGVEVRFLYAIKVCLWVEVLGTPDTNALQELSEWCQKEGWLLVAKSIKPEPPEETKKNP